MKRGKSIASFRFGDRTHTSMGTIPIQIPVPGGTFIHLEIDLVPPDVPLLIGLDILDQEQLVAKNLENELQS